MSEESEDRDTNLESAYDELAEALWELHHERQTRILQAIDVFIEAHLAAFEKRNGLAMMRPINTEKDNTK